MNANELSQNGSARLNRIRVVSQIARWVVLGFLIFSVWMMIRLLPFSHFSQGYSASTSEAARFDVRLVCYIISALINYGILCFWYWKLSQLFRFYEQGLIFASGTIRCIKNLGLLCMAGWVFMSITHFLFQPHPPFQPATSSGATVTTTTVHAYRMGFFSFDFGTGVDFGVLLGGLSVVLVAWIMDEGRKIQEEQELTV